MYIVDFLALLCKDEGLCKAFRADPKGVMNNHQLTAPQQAAITGGPVALQNQIVAEMTPCAQDPAQLAMTMTTKLTI
jgi:hypothetical protein